METKILTKANASKVCAIKNIIDKDSEIEHFGIDEDGNYFRGVNGDTIINENEFCNYEIIHWKSKK